MCYEDRMGWYRVRSEGRWGRNGRDGSEGDEECEGIFLVIFKRLYILRSKFLIVFEYCICGYFFVIYVIFIYFLC